MSHCLCDPILSACTVCGVYDAFCGSMRKCPALTEPDVILDNGPGTELSKLLKRFGISPTPTCACRAKAAEMNSWGCDEASKPERIAEVVSVMRAEAEARGLPFVDVAGRLLVRRAIQNARRNA